MSMLSHILNQECKIVRTSKNKYGDQKVTTRKNTVCRFRYITQVDKNTNRESLNTVDAIVWLEPDEPVSEGTILFIENAYWRVDRLIKARTLEGTDVEFFKAFVNAHTLSHE